MGNTASHPGSPTEGSNSPHPPQPSSTSAPTSTQPIATPSSNTTTTPASAFHSGLTPPPQPPSPPPPSTPPLLPYGGHLSPQNPHALSLPQSHDYSKSSVTRLVLEAKLAPFYRGLEDWEEEYTEDDVLRILTEIRENDLKEGVENSVVEGMKAEKEVGGGMGSVVKKIGVGRGKGLRKEEEKEERERRERRAYLGAVECPICFLNYPPNINTSRCCQQPICTECFVQIKRSEATITHLESDPACCPYCMETDFGVIYERPPLLPGHSNDSQSALSTSPEAGMSGFSLSAVSIDSEDVGPGMAPKAQEKMRRKSVSSKSKEVVLIDEIRPDWEMKLNAVKAAAARKASRRIVMRQVGDRLIPVGFTSARAPGTADFSMSVPAQSASESDASASATPSRRNRRGGSARERELEELMIMEAMRLSLLEHEDHQRRIVTEGATQTNTANNRALAPSSLPITSTTPIPSGQSSRRPSGPLLEPPQGGSGSGTGGKDKSAASKLFSKFGSRSRAGSSASANKVTFATSHAGPSSSNLAHSSTPTSPSTPITPNRSLPPSNLSPGHNNPQYNASPITTFSNSSFTSTSTYPERNEVQPGLPRLSLDMPALTPDTAPKNRVEGDYGHVERAPLNRMETDASLAPTIRPSYARLESD